MNAGARIDRRAMESAPLLPGRELEAARDCATRPQSSPPARIRQSFRGRSPARVALLLFLNLTLGLLLGGCGKQGVHTNRHPSSPVVGGGGLSYCGKPQGSGPILIKVGSATHLKAVPIGSSFVLALGQSCATPARVLGSRGVSIHPYQGSTSALLVELTKPTAVIHFIVAGHDRTVELDASGH